MPRRDVEDWYWQQGAELQKLGKDLTKSRPIVAHRRSWEPRVDLVEEDDRYVLKAELAGVNSDEIELVYLPEPHAMLLRGFRPEHDSEVSDSSNADNRIGVYQLEILYGEFEREVRLPSEPIDPSGIRASYRSGFLLVMIPKRTRTNRHRSVKVDAD